MEAPAANGSLDWEQIRAQELDQLGAKDRPDKLFGLCLSGGGIRSATFSLGILQEFERRGLLNRVDFLSTVSGGGYLGSYFLSNRREGRSVGPDNQSSLQHLRRFSNYLAPNSGMFSLDTWSMIMVWLRNTTLLQAFLISLLTAVLLLPRVWGLIASRWLLVPGGDHRVPVPWSDLTGWIILAVVFLAVSASSTYLMLAPERPRAAWLWVAVGGMALFATDLATLGFHASARQDADSLLLPFSASLAVSIACLPLLLRSFETKSGSGSTGARLVLAWAACFLVVGSLIWLAQAGLRDWATQIKLVHGPAPQVAAGFWHYAIWAVPLHLFAIATGLTFMIGFAGRGMPDLTREVWSRLAAGLFLAMLALATIGSVNIYGPLLVFQLIEHLPVWVTAGGGIGGVVTSIAGIIAAQDRGTGRGGRGAKAMLAGLAPYLFIVILVLSLSVGLHLVLTRQALAGVQSLWSQQFKVDKGGPFATPTEVRQACEVILAPGSGMPGVDLSVAYYWAIVGSQVAPAPATCRVEGAGELSTVPWAIWLFVGCIAAGLILGWRIDPNEFSINPLYRNRLVRCFMGAARYTCYVKEASSKRKPNALTGFDAREDFQIEDLADKLKGQPSDPALRMPLPIVNTALNMVGSGDAVKSERRACSMFFTPLHVFSDVTNGAGMEDFAKRQGPDGLSLGTLVATSGAAANPNCGFHTSPPVAFLLTFFNVRLGRWITNPKRGNSWPAARFALVYTLLELFGMADDQGLYINISDGGHFENLGLYELVRRRCRYIIVCDGEQDNDYSFESLGGAIRRCRDDFKAEICVDVSRMQALERNGQTSGHYAFGSVQYDESAPGQKWGQILYLKASYTGRESFDIRQYKRESPDFPHETTGDQFFSESQFESYRKLGEEVAREALPGFMAALSTKELFERTAAFEEV